MPWFFEFVSSGEPISRYVYWRIAFYSCAIAARYGAMPHDLDRFAMPTPTPLRINNLNLLIGERGWHRIGFKFSRLYQNFDCPAFTELILKPFSVVFVTYGAIELATSATNSF